MASRKVEIEIPEPEPPAIPELGSHPLIGEMRERLARLEERTTAEGVDPAAAEALRVASETRVAVDEVRNQVAALVEKAAAVATPPVVEVHPPPPVDPGPITEPIEELSPAHHPWWHPARWI